MISLTGKTFVVMGVANKRSIAWGIARSLDTAGARLVFTYAGESIEKSVHELVDSLEAEDSLSYLVMLQMMKKLLNVLRKSKKRWVRSMDWLTVLPLLIKKN